MPTYVYECRKCGHRFEEFQSITDAPRKRCPQCRGLVRRVLTPGGGLIFKGRGFYKTDYRSAEYREKERREKPDSQGESSAEKKGRGSSPPQSGAGGKSAGNGDS